LSGASNTGSESGGITVSGVSELVLEVGELDRSERFYAEVLGFPVVERWRDEAVWVMAGERTRIGLWLPQIGLGGGRGGVHVHFAMQIAEQRFDPAVELIRAAGREVYVPRPWSVRRRSRTSSLRHRPRRPLRRAVDVVSGDAPGRARSGPLARRTLTGARAGSSTGHVTW
jgi:Glyoxalase/Bleomycin resistance protein/Dioxygenase superfamily